MASDRVVPVVSHIVDSLRDFFSEGQQVPPKGGGTESIHIVAGEFAVPPAWENSDCNGCGDPFVWVRVQNRFRTRDFPVPAEKQQCGRDQRAFTVEVGVARCAPADELDLDALGEQAFIQWDDAWRIDMALCAGLEAAKQRGVATDTAIGVGEPYGPEGLIIAWLQTAQVQI